MHERQARCGNGLLRAEIVGGMAEAKDTGVCERACRCAAVVEDVPLEAQTVLPPLAHAVDERPWPAADKVGRP